MPQNTNQSQHSREESAVDPEHETQQECPECSASAIIRSSDQGELICGECGLVLDETNIDHGPEWRAFDASERQQKARTGAPLTEMKHDRGLSTTIDWKDRDAHGQVIASEKRNRLRRMRRWQKRIQTGSAGDRNLQYALSEISRMASALGIPKATQEVASVVYRQALDNDLIRGRSIEAIASGSLYIACRQDGIPRNIAEMTEVSRIAQKDIVRAYRFLSRELNLEVQPADPTQYIPRFASALDLGENVQSKAREIIETCAEKGILSGKSPTGLAAAAIYAAALLCNEKRTQREVADVANTTEVTIRNRYQEQMDALETA